MVGLILLFEPAVGAKPVLGLGRWRIISGGPPRSVGCAWAEPQTANPATKANENRRSSFVIIISYLFLSVCFGLFQFMRRALRGRPQTIPPHRTSSSFLSPKRPSKRSKTL